jgi:hypothetical protein
MFIIIVAMPKEPRQVLSMTQVGTTQGILTEGGDTVDLLIKVGCF